MFFGSLSNICVIDQPAEERRDLRPDVQLFLRKHTPQYHIYCTKIDTHIDDTKKRNTFFHFSTICVVIDISVKIIELLDYSGNTANRRKGKCKMNLKQSQVSVVEVIPLRC